MRKIWTQNMKTKRYEVIESHGTNWREDPPATVYTSFYSSGDAAAIKRFRKMQEEHYGRGHNLWLKRIDQEEKSVELIPLGK